MILEWIWRTSKTGMASFSNKNFLFCRMAALSSPRLKAILPKLFGDQDFCLEKGNARFLCRKI